MSAESGLRSCMLSILDVSVASGAASTCTLLNSRVDNSCRVRHRSSSAAGKSDVMEAGCRRLGGSTLPLSAVTRGYNHQRGARSNGGVGRGTCMSSFYGVCVPR